MTSMPSDTHDAAHRAQLAAWQRLGPEGRVRLAVQMSEDARRISLDGIRRRRPDLTDGEARFELARLLYGEDLAARAWPRRGR